MKSIILLLCLVSFAPFAANAQWYRHKSEAKIAQMTPAERVDEWVKEYAHRYNLQDEQRDLIRKYIMLDGTKALPRLTEYLDQYNPTEHRRGKTEQAVNFESCSMMLDWIDSFAVRLRSSEEGRSAINALERSIERMRAAGFAVKQDGYDWNNGTFIVASIYLKAAKGINETDQDIQNTFWFLYKIAIHDVELIELSNYLTEHYPQYPSWSERKMVRNDESSPVGFAVKDRILKKPERYYQAYLEFTQTKH